MGDLFSVVSNKEVFLPPWRSTRFFLSPQCGRKNTDIEQAGEKESQGQLRDKNQVKQAAGIFLSTMERSKTSLLIEFKIHFEHLHCKD